jgi:hypothetical protein
VICSLPNCPQNKKFRMWKNRLLAEIRNFSSPPNGLRCRIRNAGQPSIYRWKVKRIFSVVKPT